MARALRVWLADDDDELRSSVAAALRQEGCDVTEAADGRALTELLGLAIELDHEPPDVIITDLRMPGVSGIGFLDALRQARVDVPVVAMTALRDDVVLSLAWRLGAAVILRKPFGTEEVKDAIARALTQAPEAARR